MLMSRVDRYLIPIAVLILIFFLCPFAAPAQSDAAAPDMRITSRIVYVDVVVRDSAGRIVRGLTEKDFRIAEDGKPQTISYFTDHTHDALPPTALPGKQMQFSNIEQAGNSVNIILFDFYNTASQDQLYARRKMIQFLEQLPPGHQTALFVLGTRLKMLQSFTGSTDRLIAAAKAMQLESSTTQTTGTRQQETDFASAFAAAVGRSASGLNPVASGNALEAGDDMQRANDVTMLALQELALSVSGYPGRKNLYWLADSFPVYGGPALEIYDMASAVSSSTGMAVAGSLAPTVVNTQDAAEANRAIADAQIAVYPILLTGVDASGVGAEGRAATSTADLFTMRQQLHEMMDNLADTTGGRAFYGTNDFAGALRDGFEDGSNYYSLAYEPKNMKWNGDFRKIKVQLNEHGYTLTYRQGYLAHPDALDKVNVAAELNAALQPSAPEATRLQLRTSVVPPDAKTPYLLVDTTVDPAGIEFTTDANGVRHGRLLVLLVALDDHPSGKPGAQDDPPQTSGSLHLDFTPEQYAAILKSGIRFGLKLPLKPGSYELRLGISDMNNHRVGTLDMPVTVGAAG